MKSVQILRTAAVATALTAAIATPALATSQSAANQNSDHKIGICHATGSKTNPYVYIVVDKHAVPAHSDHQDGRDIIGVSGPDKCPKPATPANSKGSVLTAATTVAATQSQPAELPKTGSGLVSLLAALTVAVGAGVYTYLKRA